MSDWVSLISQDIPLAKAMEFVADPASGGTAVFLGTTRAQTSPDGKTLAALDYEAYEAMASRQLNDVAQAARRKWPIIKLVILHRVGRVLLGEPSVLVAVSTPHRAEAFAACRWLIDTLKSQATIWKKEVWSDGSGAWVSQA